MNEKYINKFNEHLARTKNVIGSLSVLNAYTLGIPKKLIIQDSESIIDFYEWFYDRYENDKQIWKEINENWGFVGPRIFRLAEEFIDLGNKAYFFNIYENYDDNIKTNIESLIDYIWNLREKRFLTFSYIDEESLEEIENDFLEIPKDIIKEELDEYKVDLKYLVIRFVELGGTFILRVSKSEEDHIYAFTSFNKEIRKKSKQELVDIYTNNPKKFPKTEIFKEAKINFI